MTGREYYIFFSYAKGIGPKTFLKLLSKFKTPQKIYRATDNDLISSGFKGKNLEKYNYFKSKFNLEKILDDMKKKNIWIITYEEFPENLKSISNPPIVLFGKGNKSLIFDKGIGIVGSRRPTSYGVFVTEKFTAELVENGLTIISGMALGVDSIAHKTCLKENGRTIAVLGSGVDMPTPLEHAGLYSQTISYGGAVVSEYPLGMQPTKGSFPARNRIISALARAVLIPEATSDSGALITAKEAFSQGRKVFVIPGPITSNLSKGTNSLLSRGGVAVEDAFEIIKELGPGVSVRKTRAKNLGLSKEEDRIYKIIESEILSIDQISRKMEVPVEKLIVILSDLELRGFLKESGGKWQIIS